MILLEQSKLEQRHTFIFDILPKLCLIYGEAKKQNIVRVTGSLVFLPDQSPQRVTETLESGYLVWEIEYSIHIMLLEPQLRGNFQLVRLLLLL